MQDVHPNTIPAVEMEQKNKETAYILWACGLLLVHGLHRFYLGKIGTGLLWFFTLGLFGVGWLVDMITLGNQVETVNLKNRALYGGPQHTPTQVLHVHTSPNGTHAHVHSQPTQEPESVPQVVVKDNKQRLTNLTKRLRKIDKLFMNEFLTDEEYSQQKNAVLKEMTMAIDEDFPEDSLLHFAGLKEEGLIDERDYNRIKGVILS